MQQEATVPKHLQSVLVTRAYWLQSSTLNDVAAVLPHLTCSSSRTQPAYLLCSFCNHATVSRSFPKKMSKLLRTMTRFNPKVCMHVLSVGQRNAASSGRNIAWRQHLLSKRAFTHTVPPPSKHDSLAACSDHLRQQERELSPARPCH